MTSSDFSSQPINYTMQYFQRHFIITQKYLFKGHRRELYFVFCLRTVTQCDPRPYFLINTQSWWIDICCYENCQESTWMRQNQFLHFYRTWETRKLCESGHGALQYNAMKIKCFSRFISELCYSNKLRLGLNVWNSLMFVFLFVLFCCIDTSPILLLHENTIYCNEIDHTTLLFIAFESRAPRFSFSPGSPERTRRAGLMTWGQWRSPVA